MNVYSYNQTGENMKPQDFNHRITLVTSEDLLYWQALNTVSHLSAYFGNQLQERFGTDKYFITEDGYKLPRNTQYPIIILKTSQTNLQQFAKDIGEVEDVNKMWFMQEMIDSTNDERIEALLSLQARDELTFLGVGIFGENKLAKKLTQNFKLYS